MVELTLPKNSKVTEGKTWPIPHAKVKGDKGTRMMVQIPASTPTPSTSMTAGRWFWMR